MLELNSIYVPSNTRYSSHCKSENRLARICDFSCGYTAGNRSKFSKHQMTGSPLFSVNLQNRKIQLM